MVENGERGKDYDDGDYLPMAPLAPAKNLSLGLVSIFMRCALCSAADCARLWLWQIAQKTLQEATATAAAAADFHAQQIVMRTGRQPTHTQTHRHTDRLREIHRHAALRLVCP